MLVKRGYAFVNVGLIVDLLSFLLVLSIHSLEREKCTFTSIRG